MIDRSSVVGKCMGALILWGLIGTFTTAVLPVAGVAEELEIIGVTAGEEKPGLPVTSALDGDAATRWSNNNTLEDAWIRYDLGEPKTIRQVNLLLYRSRSRAYPLSIAIGDEELTEIWSGATALDPGMQSIAIPETSGRFVEIRMTAANSNGNEWFSVYEITIKGEEPKVLIIQKTRKGHGSVMVDGTTVCDADCSKARVDYLDGHAYTLEARAESDSHFHGWRLNGEPVDALPALSPGDVISADFIRELPGYVQIFPKEYPAALRNPLKGFRPDLGHSDKYATLNRHYVRWNNIEASASDGVEQIIAYSNTAWKDIEQYNVKVIPRVYLLWEDVKNPSQTYWPDDMTTGDYTSEHFKTRLMAMIAKLGQAWNDDPRVAWVQMGLIGKWGEQEQPPATPELQAMMGAAFAAAFPDKKVLVRNPGGYGQEEYGFGFYWDSFAHVQQENVAHGIKAGSVWQTTVIEGETAYNWGHSSKQPGDGPDDSLRDPVHLNYILDRIRDLHCSGLGWIANYNADDPEVGAGAEEMQQAFGYRYVLSEAAYPQRVNPGETLDVSFDVTNTGSAPFYYDWPVEVSLLDPATREPVWKQIFQSVDIRTWLSGDQWDYRLDRYMVPADTYTVSETFALPADLAEGTYVLALAVLDPAGNVPSVRFAIENYYTGGRHPLGKIGVGMDADDYQLAEFDDLAADRSLYYVVDKK